MNLLVLPARAARKLARFSRPLALVLLSAFATLADSPAFAGPPVVRIEEDWEVVLGAPDPDEASPQIVAVIAPQEDLDTTTYAVFEINHSTLPEFAPGGMQLQAWVGDLIVDYKSSSSAATLATNNETITFTLSMAVQGNSLQFSVLNGSSSTWGPFGNAGHLKCSVSSTVTDLSGYQPLASARNSRVGFASHRVRKFVRTEVRYYSESGLVATVSTPYVVHEYNPAEND